MSDLVETFDEDLWEEGVDSEAFWPEVFPDTKYYVLYKDDKPVAMASAHPFSLDRYEIAYHVASDERRKGYAVELIRGVLARHPKAIFTIKTQNMASLKTLNRAIEGRDGKITYGREVIRVQVDPPKNVKTAFWAGFNDAVYCQTGIILAKE